MNHNSFILVILNSLKSITVSSKLLRYVVTLFTIPFVTPNVQQSEKDSITQVFIILYLFLHLYTNIYLNLL